MIVAIDVHYREEEAKAVAVIFKDWEDSEAFEFKIAYLKTA